MVVSRFAATSLLLFHIFFVVVENSTRCRMENLILELLSHSKRFEEYVMS